MTRPGSDRRGAPSWRTITAPESRRPVYIAALVIIAGQTAGDIRPAVDPLMAAEALFGIYYLSLLNWISGASTKARLLKRLRVKLTIGVEGLIDPTKVSRTSPARKTTRKG